MHVFSLASGNIIPPHLRFRESSEVICGSWRVRTILQSRFNAFFCMYQKGFNRYPQSTYPRWKLRNEPASWAHEIDSAVVLHQRIHRLGVKEAEEILKEERKKKNRIVLFGAAQFGHGSPVLLVDDFRTSKTCHHCGNVVKNTQNRVHFCGNSLKGGSPTRTSTSSAENCYLNER